MFRQSGDRNGVFRALVRSRQRWSSRSPKEYSPPQLEVLEDRTMLTAGQLDPTFGGGGKIVTGFEGPAYAIASHTAIQADGKIVVVGAMPVQPMGTLPTSFAVVRYLADGNLDASFGIGGIVTTRFTDSDEANAVAIQGDGKIVVGRADSRDGGDFALARYNADGTLDTTFGSAGEVTTDFSAGIDSASGVVLQPDGKILVVGDTGSINATAHITSASLAVARYNTDGSLDATFGTGGQVISATMGGGGPGVAVFFQTGVALQADGRIVVGGYTQGTSFGEDFAVVRLLANGNPDASFGTNSSVRIDFGGSERARTVAIQGDGKIIVAGKTFSFDAVNPSGLAVSRIALARLNVNGSLDSTFGIGGKITTDLGDHQDAANAVVLQPDGKIVVAGSTANDFAVARYLTDNVGTPNQRYVEQVYWDLLRRAVDGSGLASWSGLLDQGLSRAQVAAAIQTSAEYQTLIVRDSYQLVLGRAVDASGQTTWVRFLNAGGTAEQLEAILLGSDEFFVTHGSDNNQGFLPALYQIVLQRSIDPSGAQSWGQALQSGSVSRQTVAAAVLASLESDRLETQSLYLQFLHRAADPGGLNTFSMGLQRGMRNEQVAILLLSSPEYFARV